MAKGRFGHVLVPVATEADASATAEALVRHLDVDRATVVHVVEKAGGAPDKASVEQRERAGIDAFAAFRDAIDVDIVVDTAVAYDTDVADGVLAAADDANVDAVAFTPRGGGWFERILTGDITRDLLDETERPVVVLPAMNP